MLEKLSAHLSKALASGDLDLGYTLFEHLFNLRESELTPALIIDHLGVLEHAPVKGSKLCEFFQSIDEPLANAYHALEPRRIGGLDLIAQLRSVLHFTTMGCQACQDIAYSRVETGGWGLDHFKKLQDLVGQPNSLDFVTKMADSGASWRGLRSDFVAVLGLYMSGTIENPFTVISEERIEAVVSVLNELSDRGQNDIERQTAMLALCRRANRAMSDTQYIAYMLDSQLKRQILMHAHPELRDNVFGMDLGL